MSRLEWILGALLVVLLLVVASLAFTLWYRPVQPNAADVAQPVNISGQTAMAALAAAEREAENWQADAKLLTVSTSWAAREGRPYRSGISSWAFIYYSPAETAVAQITVNNNQASPALISDTDVALTPMEISGGWKVDSPEAISRALDNGGSDFLNSKRDTSLTMSLNTVGDNGRLEWLVSLFDEQSEDFIAIRLDATSGEVIEVVKPQ